MTEKNHFHGDVGQAVLGNVNEAARLNNILHLNVNEGEKPAYITDLQRRRISAKVKELVAKSSMQPLDVYGEILTEFGAAKIVELPRDRYKDAMALLDEWLNDLDTEKVPPVAAPAIAAPCGACVDAARRVRNSRTIMLTQGVLLLAGAATIGWLLWQKPAAAVTRPSSSCYVDGKSYTIGSIARMADGMVRECHVAVAGAAPQWRMPERSGPRARQR